MRTFLGIHYPPTGMRDGYGEYRDAGMAGVATIDGSHPIGPWFYATRFKINEADNPPNLYADPIGAAAPWYQKQAAKWLLNRGAQCRIINNELDIGDPAYHGVRLNKFYMAFMALNDATTPAEKIGICSFAGGNPNDSPLPNGTPCTLEQRWRPLLPSIKYAGEHGHFVVLHIHQLDKGNMETSGGQSISLRHRRSIAYWLNSAAHPECIISKPPRIIFNEVSNGVGGVEPTPDQYFKSVTWLDQYMRSDVYNALYVALCLYQAGGAEPISKTMYARLAAYMRAQSEIAINPYPSASVPPPVKIVKFNGTCPEPSFDRVASAAVSAGATIERVP